ncbi:IS3 family transposase [Bifidobacterium pullorum]|uniref:IS3 family transposase n=1 Tax=Bifidobacterium pullorum subsp. gallinarum TaxID=78344 RepID=A0A921LUT7_9BIFI|nr:IS3 family transposase [Bifidobacterium pullorum]HJG41312.1 IS3 family transposase [Bifidobacterium pullorum subsp. gallinarum]
MARAFADSRGRYGYRRVKAALGTGVSEKVIRGIMREDGLVARVPGRRRYSSYEGEAASRAGQPRQPGFHRRTTQREVAHGHHAGSRPATERCTFRR